MAKQDVISEIALPPPAPVESMRMNLSEKQRWRVIESDEEILTTIKIIEKEWTKKDGRTVSCCHWIL